MGEITVPEQGNYLVAASFEFPVVSQGKYFCRLTSPSLESIQHTVSPVYGQKNSEPFAAIATFEKGEVISFGVFNNTAGIHAIRACLIPL